MKILCIGDNVADCYLDQKKYYPGGNAVNVAVKTKRFGFDHVAYLGIFGNDKKAEHIKNSLTAEGVSFQRSRTMIGRSGAPLVTLIDGDRVFVKSRQDTAQHLVRLNLVKADLNYMEKFDLIHSSCFSHTEELLPQFKKRALVSFDFSNKRRNDEYLNKVCPHLDFAFFSGADLSAGQRDEVADKCHQLGCPLVIITRGLKGSYFSLEGQRHQQDIVSVKAIDTLGAGDAFIAGFLTAYLLYKYDLSTAAKFAAEKGAEACTYHGGWGYPHDFDGDEEEDGN